MSDDGALRTTTGAGATAGALSLTSLMLCGCPAPLFETADCGEEGEIGIVVRQRVESEVIEDGAAIPVFPPPQGGIFTELDVSIEGVLLTEITALEFEIRSDEGALLAAEFYDLEGLPLACQDDGTILSDNTPVGFELDLVLQDLEGLAATLSCSLETSRGTTSLTYDVVLRVTSF